MATTTDSRAIAGTLYEAVLSAMVSQLRATAPRLSQVTATGSTAAAEANRLLPDGIYPETRNFVLSLAQEGMLGDIDEVIAALEAYSQRPVRQQVDTEITSAVALSPEQQQQIEHDLRKRYDADLVVSYTIDESIIGGLIIRIGDQVLDNSLRTRLSAVQRNMLES
ncbi:ATP synthase F1 subunit delta [Candidatus Gracilibacteria bacterium]|nr:ATP synthase F1 subunit delta [Candidatus Gracilibacteria bacterium]